MERCLQGENQKGVVIVWCWMWREQEKGLKVDSQVSCFSV